MYRYLASILLILTVLLVSGSYFFKQYWEHRYDELIARHARVYRIDDALVWSIIWEETYFQAWKIGADQEVGLMQVMPSVARQWAAETGLRQFEEQTAAGASRFLLDPERNIQVGSWYFEKVRERYRGRPAETAMALAAYNAGASRVEEWSAGTDPATLTESDFIDRISFPSTKNYVRSILDRYRAASAPAAG